VVDALEEQLDLRRILVGPGIDLFEVRAPWAPRSDVTETPTPGEAPPAVLGEGFGTAFSGELPDDSTVAQAVTADPGWTLSTPSGDAERDTLFSWAQKFAVTEGGEADLRWSPPLSTRALQLFQVLALLGLVYLATRRGDLPTPQRRRSVARPAEPLVVVEGSEGLADWTEHRSTPVEGSEDSAEAEQGVEAGEGEALPPADSVDPSDREGPDAGDGGRDDPAEDDSAEDDSEPSGQVRRRGRSRRRKGKR
jgi:hypothetical protein